MRSKSFQLLVLAFFLITAIPACWSQSHTAKKPPNPNRPMNNLDVIRMVKAGVPESAIVTSIQTHKSKFDTSPDGLIALHKAGVTQAEMDAIMAAGAGASAPVPPASTPVTEATPVSSPPPPSAVAPSAPRSHLPVVMVIQTGTSQELTLEKTQLAQTKTKPSSLTSLASDSVVTQALQAGVNTATMSAASHMGSSIGGSSVQQAGSIFSGIMARRKPAVTYVWGVPGPNSNNVLQTSTPEFTVDYSNTPGVNPNDFEPAIVKLTPAQSACRIVGATQGKEDASSSPAADWQVYSSFLEERVTANVQKVGRGRYQITLNSALMPGEYAVVLRPVSKSMKFSGGDVARGQGNGLMFDAAWSFQISNDAQ